MGTEVCKPFQYSERGSTPEGYVCCDCGASGVRLYRAYQTFLNHQRLRCRACTLIEEGKEPDWKDELDPRSHEHSIGWSVAAVPTEEGDTYWGYTSVPPDGVAWWNQLPKSPT